MGWVIFAKIIIFLLLRAARGEEEQHAVPQVVPREPVDDAEALAFTDRRIAREDAERRAVWLGFGCLGLLAAMLWWRISQYEYGLPRHDFAPLVMNALKAGVLAVSVAVSAHIARARHRNALWAVPTFAPVIGWILAAQLRRRCPDDDFLNHPSHRACLQCRAPI